MHMPGDDGRGRGSPPPPRVRRAAADAAVPGAAQAHARGNEPWASSTSSSGVARAAVPRATCPSRSPGTRRKVIARDHARSRSPASRCTACCRATSARARRSSRSPRCSRRCRAATRVRSWHPPRCSPSSTSPACGRCSTGITVPDDGASLFGERPLAVELLTNRVARQGAPARPGRAGGGRGRPARRHPRADPGRASTFQSLGVVVIDEQHRFGVEQRAALRGEGRRRAGARRARHDGHADPADGRDDRVRRPRRVDPRRDARRPARRSSPSGPRATPTRRPTSGPRSGRRWRPVGRPTSSAR